MELERLIQTLELGRRFTRSMVKTRRSEEFRA